MDSYCWHRCFQLTLFFGLLSLSYSLIKSRFACNIWWSFRLHYLLQIFKHFFTGFHPQCEHWGQFCKNMCETSHHTSIIHHLRRNNIWLLMNCCGHTWNSLLRESHPQFLMLDIQNNAFKYNFRGKFNIFRSASLHMYNKANILKSDSLKWI